jgi:ribosome-binding factor A
MSERNQRRRRKPDAEYYETETETDASADELFGEARSRRRNTAHKDQQLCEQVFQILTYAISSINDEVIRTLVIESVTPGPDTSRLLVTAVVADPSAILEFDLELDDVLARLQRNKGFLRSEIAAGIHRKRTPELGFRLITRDEVGP